MVGESISHFDHPAYIRREQTDQDRQALRMGPSDWIPFSSITEAMIDNQNPGGEHE